MEILQLTSMLCYSALIYTSIAFATIMTKLGDNRALVLSKFMENCQAGRNMPMTIEMKGYHISKGDFNFDYHLHVRRKLKMTMLVLKVKKCPTAENLDACVSLPLIRTNRFCSMMQSETDLWSPSLNCLKPRISCEFNKGVYRGKNCSIEMSTFKMFPVTSGFWQLQSEFIADNNQTVMCIRSLGNVVRYNYS